MSSATDPQVLHDGHHPTPSTADEIRDASPDGRTLTVTTTRDEVDLEHALGTLRCLRHPATDGEDVDTLWFDLDRPGMPVRVESARSRRHRPDARRPTRSSRPDHPGGAPRRPLTRAFALCRQRTRNTRATRPR